MLLMGNVSKYLCLLPLSPHHAVKSHEEAASCAPEEFRFCHPLNNRRKVGWHIRK